MKLGNYTKGIEALNQAIRIDPDSGICAIFRFNLSLSYFQIGDIDSALDEYKILKNLDIDIANELLVLIYE